MKINNFRGELTDISAQKEAHTCTGEAGTWKSSSWTCSPSSWVRVHFSFTSVAITIASDAPSRPDRPCATYKSARPTSDEYITPPTRRAAWQVVCSWMTTCGEVRRHAAPSRATGRSSCPTLAMSWFMAHSCSASMCARMLGARPCGDNKKCLDAVLSHKQQHIHVFEDNK